MPSMNRSLIFLFPLLVMLPCFSFQINLNQRLKRDADGELDIVNNNAHPIHAEVKPDATQKSEAKPEEGKPEGEVKKEVHSETPQDSPVKVTAPKDVVSEPKSLRKSMPLNNKLDIIRNVNRAITIVVLAVSLGIECYPVFAHLYNSVFNGVE